MFEEGTGAEDVITGMEDGQGSRDLVTRAHSRVGRDEPLEVFPEIAVTSGHLDYSRIYWAGRHQKHFGP